MTQLPDSPAWPHRPPPARAPCLWRTPLPRRTPGLASPPASFNVLADEDGAVTGVIDWANAAAGDPLLDRDAPARPALLT